MFNILFLLLVICPSLAVAQFAMEGTGVSSQWQLTVDVIKSKAQSLLVQNNELSAKSQDLNSQLDALQRAVNKLKATNEGLRQFIKDRKGKTDQQIKLEELTHQFLIKKGQLLSRQAELNEWNNRLADVERKIKLKQLKIAELQLRQDQREVEENLKNKMADEDAQRAKAGEKELDGLRKQLEEAKAQEAIFERDLATFGENQEKNAQVLKERQEENNKLAQRLEYLHTQKVDREKLLAALPNPAAAPGGRYLDLKHQKIVLEAQVHDAEAKLEDLKSNLLPAHQSWPVQKKKLIHEMVQADARNSQLRDKVNSLREDIEVLKDQIGKLERRVNFMNGKGKSK